MQTSRPDENHHKGKSLKVFVATGQRESDELIPHPACSPDLAPSDFFLFSNLKKDICG